MSDKKERFLKILNEHQRIIFKVGHMYCPNIEEQRDLTQDIIIQLWKSLDKYDPTFKMSTWLYRIALNVAISSHRKRTTRKKHENEYASYFLEISQKHADIEDENVRLLRSFIDQLDPINKAMMILYLDGNSHQEIAEILDISVSNVGTRIGRTKKRLLENFQKQKI